jgi:hypothetical protein
MWNRVAQPLLVISSIFTLCCSWSCEFREASPTTFPSYSDDSAIVFWRENKAKFDEVKKILEEHHFEYISNDGAIISPPDAFDDLPEVKNSLVNLMKNLHLQSINGIDSDWGIRLTYLSSGLATAGSEKSFWHGKEPPSRLVSKIDDYTPDFPGASGVARKLEEDWYLFFSWGG